MTTGGTFQVFLYSSKHSSHADQDLAPSPGLPQCTLTTPMSFCKVQGGWQGPCLKQESG